MKKIALLAMLCVFSIVGAQSVQAVEDKNIDVKSHPQMERRHEHYKFENEGLTKKEIEKRKKEHKKWEEQKKKDWEKRKKQKEKNKKQWEHKNKNWDKQSEYKHNYHRKKSPRYDGRQYDDRKHSMKTTKHHKKHHRVNYHKKYQGNKNVGQRHYR